MLGNQYQNFSILDFIGARVMEGGGNNWRYKTMQSFSYNVTTNKATPSFYKPDARPIANRTVSEH